MNTNVLVYESDEYCSDFPPTNLQEFVLFFDEMLYNIPEEYKDSAEIEVSTRGYYGESPYAEIKVSYERPETEEEKKEREKVERSKKLFQKERELAELERLKKKYESFDEMMKNIPEECKGSTKIKFSTKIEATELERLKEEYIFLTNTLLDWSNLR